LIQENLSSIRVRTLENDKNGDEVGLRHSMCELVYLFIKDDDNNKNGVLPIKKQNNYIHSDIHAVHLEISEI
jgi:hypothetical protein